MTTNEHKERNCKCKKNKVIQYVLLGIIAAGTIVSAYYSYNSNKVLTTILNGGQPAQAQPAGETITKKYAKNQTLEKALKSNKPIVAFFYADWCGYCKRFAPTFAKVTKNKAFKEKLNVAYINGDNAENAKHMAEYKVQGFPTVYLINPQTGVKKEVNNQLLFSPNAEVDLLNEFTNFAK